MEVKRLLSVLDEHLRYREFIMDEQYTLADMAIFPWVHQLRRGYRHAAGQLSMICVCVVCMVVMLW